MVPAVPLLFFAMVPVLLALPRWAAYVVVVPTVIISFSVTMSREDVPSSLLRIFTRGLELPWLSVLTKTAAGYRGLPVGRASVLLVFAFLALAIGLLWKQPRTAQ